MCSDISKERIISKNIFIRAAGEERHKIKSAQDIAAVWKKMGGREFSKHTFFFVSATQGKQNAF